MTNTIKYAAASLLLLIMTNLNAQEIVTGLRQNNDIINHIEKKAIKKSALSSDTIDIPFFDDFTIDNIYPSSLLWSDKDVYINNTYALNQISQGIATFDAIDSKGLLYEEAGSFVFEADHLTSNPVDLNIDPAENIYLSFYYQPEGIADQPEPADSLILQFLSSSGEWNHIWKAEGGEVHNFKPVIIRIDNPQYLYRGFRFRFINYASISSTLNDPAMAGNADHWNVDYVYLDTNRNASDTIPVDVAFTSPVRSVLNTYESMPWDQFREVFLSEMGSFININYRNNDEVTRNVTRSFVIRDMYDEADVHSFSAGATNIDPGEWVSYDANLIYTFNSGYSDSALFRIRSILTTDEFDVKTNDTIDYFQVFNNYFSYDDGSAESGYGVNGQGASNAMVATRFRTFEPDTLRAIKIAFNDSYLSSNQRYFNIAVWSDINGIPGTLLYEQEEMVDPGLAINGFITFILNDPLPVEGFFHVGWTQQSETFLNVSLDLNTLPEGRRHYYINGNWNESEVPGSLMIRPVVGREIPASGIEDIFNPEENRIHIWPNPVSDHLNIDLLEYVYYKNIRINIYDNNGRRLISTGRKERIDLSRLEPGIYHINISDGRNILGYNRFIIL